MRIIHTAKVQYVGSNTVRTFYFHTQEARVAFVEDMAQAPYNTEVLVLGTNIEHQMSRIDALAEVSDDLDRMGLRDIYRRARAL
jgi:hypothetical protein